MPVITVISVITETREMTDLTPISQKFVIHWGEMGERWGINRTVAQIHALLYISAEPLNAEQISQTLSVARSTVSAGLRELQSWGLINIVHHLGDRTDYFEAMSDVWEMFRVIVDRRKKREVDPTLEMLREVVGELENNSTEDARSKEKMIRMLDLFETTSALYEKAEKVPTKTIMRVAKMSDVIRKILAMTPDS
jgi:DNA-binding transcriptional regulator GbsR (MarR family)